MTESITYIYALRHPEDGSIFYVGKSNNPETRYRGRMKDSHKFGSKFLYERVRQMYESGNPAIMTVLSACSIAEWKCREREWIAYFRGVGVDLLNVADGGDGRDTSPRGIPMRDAEERRTRLRAAWRLWYDSLTAEQKSEYQSKKMTPAVREKLSRDRKGVTRSPEHIKASRDAQRTPEFHAKMSASQKKLWENLTPEQKEEIAKKRSIASSKVWASLDASERYKRTRNMVSYSTPEKLSERSKSFWRSLTPERKEEFIKKRIATIRKRGISKEEHEKRSRASRQTRSLYWARTSEVERKAIMEKVRAAKKRTA